LAHSRLRRRFESHRRRPAHKGIAGLPASGRQREAAAAQGPGQAAHRGLSRGDAGSSLSEISTEPRAHGDRQGQDEQANRARDDGRCLKEVFAPMTWSSLIFWTTVCLVLEAFFSGSELAIVSADKLKLAHRSAQGNKGAKAALALANRPEWFFSSIL